MREIKEKGKLDEYYKRSEVLKKFQQPIKERCYMEKNKLKICQGDVEKGIKFFNKGMTPQTNHTANNSEGLKNKKYTT